MTDYVKPGAGSLEGCPSEARAFLLERGLPRNVGTMFAAATRSAKTSRVINGQEVDGIILGFSGDHCELCLDFKVGKVWLLAPWRPDDPILVNTTVQAFAESLEVVASMDADSSEDAFRRRWKRSTASPRRIRKDSGRPSSKRWRSGTTRPGNDRAPPSRDVLRPHSADGTPAAGPVRKARR
jgi:hypothetical protein